MLPEARTRSLFRPGRRSLSQELDVEGSEETADLWRDIVQQTRVSEICEFSPERGAGRGRRRADPRGSADAG